MIRAAPAVLQQIADRPGVRVVDPAPEVRSLDSTEFRVPLLRLGDKYLHIAEEMVYERRLAEPLPSGLCHVVFQVDELVRARDAALAAGATEIAPVSRVSAGFGTRDVAFLRSPGGILFELINVVESAVPELP